MDKKNRNLGIEQIRTLWAEKAADKLESFQASYPVCVAAEGKLLPGL